jgi:hypothetical protein
MTRARASERADETSCKPRAGALALETVVAHAGREGERRMKAPALLGWLIAVVAGALSVVALGQALLGPGVDEFEQVAQQWFVAIHERDFEQLARYDAHAPADREGRAFQAWKHQVSRILDDYEQERDAGSFEPDPTGYKIVRATMLGRGTYWETVGLFEDGEARVLRIRLNFGYGKIYYGSLPAGTTVYLLGYPLGTVHAVELGHARERKLDVLQHLTVDVRFERVEARLRGDARWQVSRLRWHPDSAEHEQVRWIF